MATGFDSILNPPHTVVEPAVQSVPFVFNSPHSGRNYTPQFLSGIKLNRSEIRRSEDFRIDELFAGVPSQGGMLLIANFPRAFLDVNREPYELDPTMFCDTLPEFANTRSARVAGGLGTIARIVSETDEIYGRKLLANEALERIDTIYKPYHTQLRSLLAETHAKFGYSVLIDCHSMPSAKSGSMRKGRPDFVLGDRFGTSCSQQVTWAASQILSAMGYDIEINKPYAGGFITEHYGRPDQGFHAIQIEINRGLYMNEQKLEKNARFDAVCRDITRFVSRLVAMPGDGLAGDQQIAAE